MILTLVKTNLELSLMNKRSNMTLLGGIVFGEKLSHNYGAISQTDILMELMNCC